MVFPTCLIHYNISVKSNLGKKISWNLKLLLRRTVKRWNAMLLFLLLIRWKALELFAPNIFTYLPFFVTIISFVRFWNRSHKSRSSNVTCKFLSKSGLRFVSFWQLCELLVDDVLPVTIGSIADNMWEVAIIYLKKKEKIFTYIKLKFTKVY